MRRHLQWWIPYRIHLLHGKIWTEYKSISLHCTPFLRNVLCMIRQIEETKFSANKYGWFFWLQDGETCFLVACATGHVSVIQRLAQEGMDLVLKVDKVCEFHCYLNCKILFSSITCCNFPACTDHFIVSQIDWVSLEKVSLSWMAGFFSRRSEY